MISNQTIAVSSSHCSTTMPPPRTAIRHISRLARRQPLSTSARRLDSHHSAPHDPAPAAESFGRSFYLVLALIPSTYIVYNISKDPGNSLTQSLRKWSDFKDYWAAQNALHARMVEQAGHDRNLFTNSPSPVWHDLQFPEVFSMGSPIAVPAG